MTENQLQLYARLSPDVVYAELRGIFQRTFSMELQDAQDLAQEMMSVGLHPTGIFAVADREREAEKLAKLRAALLQAKRLLEDLHPELRSEISKDIVSRPTKVATSRGAIHTIQMIDQTIVPSISAAEKALAEFDAQGRTNWRAVSVFMICRAVWEECMGKAPPQTVNEETPFGEFCQSVLDVFELGHVRSAARAHREKARRS